MKTTTTKPMQHPAAVVNQSLIARFSKLLSIVATFLLLSLPIAHADNLTTWYPATAGNSTRSIVCGTSYTFTTTINATSTLYDNYCVITSSRLDCPITVTLGTHSSLGNQNNKQDYIYVYEGSGTTGTTLASWSKNTADNTTVTSSTGQITIRFDKNSGSGGGGGGTNRTFTLTIYQPCCSEPYSCDGNIYTIATGTSASYTYGPVNDYYNYSYCQILYNSSELGGQSGMIEAMAFQYAGSSAMSSKTNVTVYMANTTTASFASSTSWITSGLTQVYSGSLNCVGGWNWFPLDVPFNYDGTNLLLVIDDNSGAYDGTAYTFYYSGSTSDPYRQIYYSNDTYNYGNESTSSMSNNSTYSNYRPNTKFCISQCTPRSGNFSFATSNVTMLAGETYTQTVTTNISGTIEYSSSNTSLATVNASTGQVTAASGVEGSVTITATIPASDGYCRASASYNINIGDGCSRVGTGTSYYDYYTPIYSYSSGYYSYTQQEYTAEEILAAGGAQGDITDIKFQYYGTSDLTLNITVYMGSTNSTPLENSWVTDAHLTQVYSGVTTFSQGWSPIHLTSPYSWDGVSNIVVAVKTNGAPTSSYYYFYYTALTSPYMARYDYVSGSAVATNSTSNLPTSATGYSTGYRPNMKFCINPCDDNLDGDFKYEESLVEHIIGNTFTPQTITNTTGVSNAAITYSSDNDEVGTVNVSSGIITFTGNEGNLTITAKLSNPGSGCDKYAKYTINVNDGCKRAGIGTEYDWISLIPNYTYSYSQMIYKSTEIGAGGTINRIGFNAQSAGTLSRSVKIYMAVTDKNTFSSATDFIPLSQLTLVYSGTNWTVSEGWNYFNLSQPFDLPCGKNLVVAIDCDGSTYSTEYFYYTTVTSSCVRGFNDSSNPSTSDMEDMSSFSSTALVAYRANIKICMTECTCPDFQFELPSVRLCKNDANASLPDLIGDYDGTPSFASSNTSVIQVNTSTGAITRLAVGTATITATIPATASHCEATASCKVTVLEECPVLHYNLNNCTGTATPSSIPDLVGTGMVQLSPVTPTCSTPGMVFAGWCNRQNGEGGYWQPGADFSLYQDTTLYAIFYTKCCHPDSANVTYTHQQVNWRGDGTYTILEGATNNVTRSDDGYFYYDLCYGENNGKVMVDVDLRGDCSYSNMQWAFEYADQTNTHYTNNTTHFEADIDSIIGYGLSFSAYSSEGCWLHLYGRVRVSPGISVASMDIPTFTICPGNVSPITVGYPENGEIFDIQVDHPGTHLESTLGHAERIFLPDGVACDLDGDGTSDCGYVSSVTFTDFQNGAVVRSVEDILYLSMTIEHSFIGDLFIKVTCPNGQEATILKKYTSGTSSCLNAILALSEDESDVRGWQVSGSSGADFGRANSDYASSSSDYACDSSYSSNAIGTPWTYAWSNNTTRGYEYAGGTYGLIYETENVGNDYSGSVDSTHLDDMTNLYHPDQSFASLVGCPLNGEWKITVIDGYSVDNGWLVDWQLALSEDLAGKVWNYQVDLDTATLSCNWNTSAKTHAGFVIEPPETITTGNYTCGLSLFDEYGCVATSDINLSFIVKELTVESTITPASCGGSDGKIQLSATGGGDGVTYTYQMGGESNTTGLFSDLTAGSYTIQISSSEGCMKSETFEVTTTGQMTLSMVSITDEKCAGAGNGAITVAGSEGTAPYTYTLNGESNTTGTFTGLTPGTYTVTAVDDAGCSGSISNLVVGAPDTLKVSLTLPESGQCPIAAGSNYSIGSSFTGGSGSISSYVWSGDATGTGATGSVASNGKCKSYSVSLTVKDGNECTAVATGTFTAVDDQPPVITTTAVNNTDLGCDPDVEAPLFTATDICSGDLTASIIVTTDGSQGAGCAKSQTWTANVKDACDNSAEAVSITYTWTESQKPTIDAIADQQAEMGNEGCKYKMIDLEAVTLAAAHDGCGGTVEFVSQSVPVGTEYTQADDEQPIQVTVTVKGTCDKTETAVVNVIIPAKDISVSIDQTGASVCAGGDTTLTATGSSSNGTPTYAWSTTGSTTLTPTTGTSTTATATGAATVTVTATDPAGCTATDNITVSINPETTIAITNDNQEKCLGTAIDNITITYTNGTLDATAINAALAPIGGLTFTDAGNGSSTITGQPEHPGDYSITITATSNQTPACDSKDASISLNITNTITPVINAEENICVSSSETNTQLTLSETAGDNTFTYTWNVGTDGTIVSGQGSNSIVAQWSSAGDKDVTVTLTLGECSSQALKTIHVRPAPVATITPITDDVCPNAGTIDITGTTTESNANYTYTWGGTLTLNHTTNTIAATSDVVTATIPSDNCNTSYNVTLNVVDQYGCKNTASPISIIVKDETAPTITGTMPVKNVDGCSADLTTLYPVKATVAELEAEATALGGSLSISDNCTTDKSLLQVSSTESNSGSCPIVVTRTYTITDQCGKQSTLQQTININMADNITMTTVATSAPVSCPSEATAENITLPVVKNACGEELEPTAESPVITNGITGCEGTKEFKYIYKDCADHTAEWVFTYTVTHPDVTIDNDSTAHIACLQDTSNTFLPRNITDDCGNTVSAVLVGEPDMSGYNAVTGSGNVVFNYQYTDCTGKTYPWVLTYNITPGAFTPTTNGASTVSCLSMTTPQAPEERVVCGVPLVYVADANNPIDDPVDIEAAGGCGTRTYHYTYNTGGTDYDWYYVYTIRPDSIVFSGNVPTRDTVECDDPTFEPTQPTVKTNCGIAITTPTSVTTGGTYTDCEGTRTWTYVYTDCTGRTRNWTFTRLIRRTTAPHQEGEVDTVKTVECLASTMNPPATLPVVKDVCLNDCPVPTPTIDSTWDGCTGQKTYKYVYTDCAGLTYTWRYHYIINRTGAIHQVGDVETERTIHCIADTLRPTTLPTMKDTCGNILAPVNPMPEAEVAMTGCVGTVKYTYNYIDCAGKTASWTYTNKIDRSAKPHIVTAGGTPRTVICEGLAVADSILLPEVEDQCGVALTASNPVISNNWTSEPCNGERTFSYEFRDCADSLLTWTYTFTIDLPDPTLPAQGASVVQCESAASLPTPPTVTDTCGNTLTVDAGTIISNTVVEGAGAITYRFIYTDCEGNNWPWNYVYTVSPDPIAFPDDKDTTVWCASAVSEPTTPNIPICESAASFTLRTPAATIPDCGDYVYEYDYRLNGEDTVWRYTYHIQPADFVFPNVSVDTTMECYNGETPSAPTITSDSTCGEVSHTALVQDPTLTTYDGCEGDVVFKCTYSNCAYSHDWIYTYHIERTTIPQVGTPGAASVTCADLATETFDMPTVTDACGATITTFTTEPVTGNAANCNGSKIYSYTYTDCTGRLSNTWTYTYTINDNIPPTIADIADQDAVPEGNCTYRVPDLEAIVLAASTDNCSAVTFVSQSVDTTEIYNAQNTATTVPVIVTVTDECGNNKTAIVNVIVPANSITLPVINGVAICEGETATLTADGTSVAGTVTYDWSPTTNLLPNATSAEVQVSPTTTTTYTVIATDPVGCSAQRTVVVSVNHPTSTAFTQEVCEGYTWSNHGWSETYDVSGNYIHEYTTAQNCPSADTLHLTVYYNTSTEFTETACDSYTWENNGMVQTYTVSGTYYHDYNTAEGCPSTDVLYLTINYNTNRAYSETVCDVYTWNNHGMVQQYTTSGTYTHDYLTDEGCPSRDELNLIVNYSQTTDLYVTECEEYTWYYDTYTTSGDYVHHLTTNSGCDSLLNLHLTIINTYETTLYDTVCTGVTYTWFGNNYDNPGVYEHMMTASNGCDSLITLRLFHFPTVRVAITEEHDCRTGEYKLTGNIVNADTYLWSSDPDNGDLNGQESADAVTVTPLVGTTYKLTAGMANHMECAESTTLHLNPVKVARAAIETHPAYLTIDRLDWNASDRSNNAIWRQWYVEGEYWSTDDHISGTVEPGIDSLSLMLIVGTEECADTAHRAIPYMNVGIWLPNIFTPSQDFNNLFGPVGTGIDECEMWIYTREGLLVFHSETMEDKWDGTHNGKNCAQGSYTYKVIYSTKAEPNEKLTIVGTVTVLR